MVKGTEKEAKLWGGGFPPKAHDFHVYMIGPACHAGSGENQS